MTCVLCLRANCYGNCERIFVYLEATDNMGKLDSLEEPGGANICSRVAVEDEFYKQELKNNLVDNISNQSDSTGGDEQVDSENTAINHDKTSEIKEKGAKSMGESSEKITSDKKELILAPLIQIAGQTQEGATELAHSEFQINLDSLDTNNISSDNDTTTIECFKTKSFPLEASDSASVSSTTTKQSNVNAPNEDFCYTTTQCGRIERAQLESGAERRRGKNERENELSNIGKDIVEIPNIFDESMCDDPNSSSQPQLSSKTEENSLLNQADLDSFEGGVVGESETEFKDTNAKPMPKDIKLVNLAELSGKLDENDTSQKNSKSKIPQLMPLRSGK